MRIAIFDHLINDGNAIGKCHREILSHLADEHEFTVFALEFDNPRPDRIRFIRVPAMRRPLLGLLISFHILAPLFLWWYRHVRGERFDLVQGIGGNFLGSDLAYGHFCHRVYLRDHIEARPKAPIRRFYSWVYDSIVSMLEPIIYENATYIVTPSHGLACELSQNFNGVDHKKIHIISNPIDVDYMIKPPEYDSSSLRNLFNFADDDLVMVFVGAGHFERKGLPILLHAMTKLKNPAVKLIVVGGRQYLVEEYEKVSKELGLCNQVKFVGFQRDIRPYLWASDVFVFPSFYEIFPLVSLEAAAAGLPLLSAPLYGVQEFLEDSHNGWQVDRSADAFAEKIEYAFYHRDELARMGQNAAMSVKRYSINSFGDAWKEFYATIEHGVSRYSSLPYLPPKNIDLEGL